MKKVIVSHIYNEEYLLPWWLHHHKTYFDHGIIIDYGSTDRSHEIIKEICPTWEIVNSRNLEYNEVELQAEIFDYESQYGEDVWKICLNVTEFLIGDFNSLDYTQGVNIIPCLYFIDNQELRDSSTLLYDKPLWDYIKTGLDVPFTLDFRGSRALHTPNFVYPPGRHFRRIINTDRFIIFNYGFAPMTEEFYKRKLQIQKLIPYSERLKCNGGAHTDALNPNGLTRERLVEMYREYLPLDNPTSHGVVPRCTDLTNVMNQFLFKLPK
jgi:hypothetical protein